MSEVIETTARSVLDHAPCALEMPAGSGKTQLLAVAVAVATSEGKRSLILTHTNAGVDALRKRLKKFGVPAKSYHIDTITSWAFTLVRAYGKIARLEVPEIPDWSDSKKYIEAAMNVARAASVRAVHESSFDYFFVDEYQDCSMCQHDLLVAIADCVPRTVILGDRLQGIFGFNGETLVDWDTAVFSRFPKYEVECLPHRWSKSNPALGQWLLDLRPGLSDGVEFDFSSVDVPGFKWVCSSPSAVCIEAHRIAALDEPVVLLDKWSSDIAGHASRLGGSYSVMEELQGKFMINMLNTLPPDGEVGLALWLANFSKSCAIGLAGLDRTVLAAVEAGRSVGHYKRSGLGMVLSGLDDLIDTPSYLKLVDVASTIRYAGGVRIYRWEAWRDTFDAIENSIQSGRSPIEELTMVRDRLRRVGRRPQTRIASRTLLVKGLEYDHVIVADMTKMRDPRNLYVALTRARKSITLIGPSSRVLLRNDN